MSSRVLRVIGLRLSSMLSFLSPLFLAGAAAAAVPIVLHLLKREPEPRVKFAAVKLLKHAPVEYTADGGTCASCCCWRCGSPRCVLLALAFARPFFAVRRGASASAGATIVALDTSFSMSAPGRFERARQLAKDAIAQAPAGDLVGVVTFADEAEIAAKPRRRSRAGARRRSTGDAGFRRDAVSRRAVRRGSGARRPPRHDRRRHRSAGERLGRGRPRVGAGVRRRSRSPTSARCRRTWR